MPKSKSGSLSVLLHSHPPGPVFTSRTVSSWLTHYVHNGSILAQLVLHWASIVKSFLLESRWKNNLEMFRYLEDACILMIREMRATASRSALPEAFRAYLKSSGLGRRIIRYLRHSLNLEKREWFDVSYRKYRWTESVAAVLADWCRSTGIARPPMLHPYKRNSLGHPGFQALNSILLLLDELLPFIARPELVFFLSAKGTFEFFLRSIVVPYVLKNRSDRYLVLPRLCSKTLYQHLIGHIRAHRLRGLTVSSLFQTIVLHAITVKDTIRRIERGYHSGSCDCTANTPFEIHCKRTLWVDRKTATYLSRLRGKVLRDFEDGLDVPLDNGGHSVPSYYLSPDELSSEFIRIQHRPTVFASCGRDITIFKDRETRREVGGVSYGGLGDYLPRLRDHHQHIVTSNRQTMKRGMDDGGIMVGVGNRLGAGGRPGDTYSMYASTVIDPDDPLTTAVRVQDTGSDASAVMEVLKLGSSAAHHNIAHAAQEARTRHLGTQGVSGVYCSNYIAPQHNDRDASFTVAAQVTKCSPSPSHFSFVYSEWGIVIQTREDTVFWFDSDALHGTLSCKRSDLVAGASVSDGVGFMVRTRDADFARKMATTSLIHLELEDAFKVY
ncbi:hypothetical protein V5O48_008306 [Marasmius crinis-equi]|uniref:TLDc domain-containing protein n=1 Tax=Marasmius crinis-equi TaxID=585013 RepID=A0ABR3FEE6_9AGAR